VRDQLKSGPSWDALQAAIVEIQEKVPQLKINAAKMKGNVLAAWQVEDSLSNKLFIVLTGPSSEKARTMEELVLTIESDVGQLLEFQESMGKAFLEMNYNRLNLARVGLGPEGRVVVLHRRWFDGLSVKDAFDAIAEVWNIAEELRQELGATKPGIC
jgi:hypothetical protein